MKRHPLALLLAFIAALGLNSAAWAQAGPGPPPGGGGGGSGTVTSVTCPNTTITTTGPCTPLSSAGTSGNVVTVNGAGVQDSGTALTGLLTTTTAASTYAPINNANLTGTPQTPTAGLGTNTNQIASTAFVIANSVAGSGQTTQPPRISGNWYMPWQAATLITGTAMTSGRVVFEPFIVPAGMTLGHVGVRITTLASGGNIQAAIYSNTNTCTGAGITSCPLTQLCATGSFSTTAVGQPTPQVCSATLTAGTLYWMGTNVDATAGTVAICQVANSGQVFGGWLIGSATQSSISTGASTGALALHGTVAFGTWGSMSGVSFVEDVTQSYCLVELQAA